MVSAEYGVSEWLRCLSFQVWGGWAVWGLWPLSEDSVFECLCPGCHPSELFWAHVSGNEFSVMWVVLGCDFFGAVSESMSRVWGLSTDVFLLFGASEGLHPLCSRVWDFWSLYPLLLRSQTVGGCFQGWGSSCWGDLSPRVWGLSLTRGLFPGFEVSEQFGVLLPVYDVLGIWGVCVQVVMSLSCVGVCVLGCKVC